jgi:16S rRNA (uracil1498-N3)-methyltransferase
MRRFYSPPDFFSNDTVTLSAEETRHLRDVLRLRAGDQVRVFDGEGHEFQAEVYEIARTSTALKIIAEVRPLSEESPLRLALAVAMLKSDKFDLVVQKAVELGVAHLIPLETARSEHSPRIAGKKTERWRKIALESAKQCGRAELMRIDEPIGLQNVTTVGTVLLFTERNGGAFPSTTVAGTEITAFVGPEGGWDDSELEFARSKAFQLVTLGGRILRAETAAIAVTAILQHRLGDMR